MTAATRGMSVPVRLSHIRAMKPGKTRSRRPHRSRPSEPSMSWNFRRAARSLCRRLFLRQGGTQWALKHLLDDDRQYLGSRWRN
jgi:hypothetical protein